MNIGFKMVILPSSKFEMMISTRLETMVSLK